MTTKSKTIRKPQNQKKYCDSLWSELIKKRAGYKSEYSGKLGIKAGGTEILHSHHLAGKKNNRLRYELLNGICLTAGEHKFIAHNQGRYEDFRKRIQQLRGEDIFEKLNSLKKEITRIDLIKIYLEQKNKEINN